MELGGLLLHGVGSALFWRHSGNVYRMAFRLVLFGEGVTLARLYHM